MDESQENELCAWVCVVSNNRRVFERLDYRNIKLLLLLLKLHCLSRPVCAQIGKLSKNKKKKLKRKAKRQQKLLEERLFDIQVQ